MYKKISSGSFKSVIYKLFVYRLRTLIYTPAQEQDETEGKFNTESVQIQGFPSIRQVAVPSYMNLVCPTIY